MTLASTYPRSSHSAAPVLLFMAVIVIAMIALASTHAVIRHGAAAISAQNCFNGSGTVAPQSYLDPMTGRKMFFCNQRGNWFVRVDDEKGRNVTMFPRSFARCLRDVIEYAQRSGYITPYTLH
jgi:hypothetical protein